MLALVVVACSKQDAPVPVGASTPVAAGNAGRGNMSSHRSVGGVFDSLSLERSGFVPKIDSGAKPQENR